MHVFDDNDALSVSLFVCSLHFSSHFKHPQNFILSVCNDDDDDNDSGCGGSGGSDGSGSACHLKPIFGDSVHWGIFRHFCP